MIIQNHQDIVIQGFTTPSVGIAAASEHLQVNKRQLEQFVSSILEFCSTPHDVRLAISIEQTQFVLMTHKEAMRKVTDEYRVTAGFNKDMTRSDIRLAMDYGVLPFLSSAQLLVRRVNEFGASHNAATGLDISNAMSAIDRDLAVIYQTVAEIMALRNQHRRHTTVS